MATIFDATFTSGADQNVVTEYTPDIGSAMHYGYGSGAIVTGGTGFCELAPAGGDRQVEITDIATSNVERIEFDYTGRTSGTPVAEMWLRKTTDVETGYRLWHHTSGTVGVRISRVVAGVGTTLYTNTAAGGPVANKRYTGFFEIDASHVITFSIYNETDAVLVDSGTLSADGSPNTQVGRGCWGGNTINVSRVTFKDASGGGSPPGIATETDTALALSGKQIRAAGMATETDTALALVTLAGLPFNTAPYEFGQRTGLDVDDFSLYASTSLNVSVYAATDVLLASQLFAYTESTGTDGRLTRKTHASLTAGTTYIFVAVTTGGALVAAGRIQAT